MRPLTLEMEGFTSFRERTFVDFRDLDLVAFVGPTGSGKSSIIDAMTFALYGSIARYRDEKQVSSAVNTLAAEAKVCLVFEAGGDQYTATRIVRRSKDGRASTKEARLERGTDVIAGNVSELNEAVIKLLGLKFDEFTKTVVLPQGEFARFLHDTPSKRQELLRRVMSLEVYQAMASMARRRADTAKSKLELLEGQLAEGAEVTKAEVDRADRSLRAARKVQEDIKPVLDQIDSTKARIADLDDDAQSDSAARVALANLAEPSDLDEVGEAFSVAAVEVKALDGELAAAQQLAREASDAMNEGPDKSALVVLKTKLASLAASEKDLHAAREKLAAAASENDLAVADLDKVEDGLAALRTEVDEAAAAIEPLSDELQRLPARAQVERNLERLDEADEIAGDRAQKQADLDSLTERLESLRLEAKTAEAHKVEAQAQVVAAQARAGAAAVAEGLSPGDSCPVCGGTFHQLADHSGNEALEAARAELSRRTSLVDDLNKQVASTANESKLLADSIAAADKRIASLTDTAGGSRSELLQSLAAIDKGEAALEAQKAEHQRVAAALRGFEQGDQVAAVRKRAANASLALQLATGREADLVTQIAGLQSELGDVDLADVEAGIQLADELASALKLAQQHESHLRTKAQQAKDAFEEAERRSDDLERQFNSARDTVAALSPPPRTGTGVVDEWRTLIEWSKAATADLDSRAAERKALNDQLVAKFEQHEAAAQELLASAGIEPDDQTSVEVAVASAVHMASQQLNDLTTTREQQLKLKEQIKDLADTVAVHSTLARHLAKGQFEAWLLEEVVASLTELATDRLFQLSGGQYSLEVDGTEFQVRDHRNADERRDAKTLSGGETFLASLSLALALGDSVREMAQDGSTEIESIFLDEGFGTLDADTLDTVATAIEELGSSGRMVGLVTHIRELADRVPARFEVTKNAVTSTVTRIEL